MFRIFLCVFTDESLLKIISNRAPVVGRKLPTGPPQETPLERIPRSVAQFGSVPRAYIERPPESFLRCRKNEKVDARIECCHDGGGRGDGPRRKTPPTS